MTSATPLRMGDMIAQVSEGASTPRSPVRPPARPAPAMLGTNRYSSIMRRIRARVSASTSGFSLSTRETVAIETPASRPISRIVILVAITLAFFIAFSSISYLAGISPVPESLPKAVTESAAAGVGEGRACVNTGREGGVTPVRIVFCERGRRVKQIFQFGLVGAEAGNILRDEEPG